MPSDAHRRDFGSLYSHGFARVAAAVPHLRIADPISTRGGRSLSRSEPRMKPRRVVIFPELGLTGYSIEDLFHQQALLDGALEALDAIREASVELTPRIVPSALRCAPTADSSTPRSSSIAGGCSASCPRAICPSTTSSMRSGISGQPGTRSARRSTCWASTCRSGPGCCSKAPTCPSSASTSRSARTCGRRSRPARYGALAGATVLANLSGSDITVGKADYRRLLCPPNPVG